MEKDKVNERLLNLNLSHSIIPRTSMDWNQWFWYAGASDDKKICITQKYLKMKDKQSEVYNEETWRKTVYMCYAVGTLALIGFATLLYYLIPYLLCNT